MASLPIDPKRFPISIPPRQRTDSSDSEVLSVSPMAAGGRSRGFSFSEMLGSQTSVGEAFDRYTRFTTNGDGFKREEYHKD